MRSGRNVEGSAPGTRSDGPESGRAATQQGLGDGVASTLVGSQPEPPPPDLASLSAGTDRRDTGVHSISEFALEPGTVLGEYRIERRIGEGATGTVFRAIHPMIGKRAAIKVLKAHLCRDGAAIERFIDEARAVNQIGHPNIVDIFALGEMPDGRRYLVMELLVGETLREHVRRSRTSLPEMARIVRTLARALEAAHQKGIVHRDLKPENVLLVDMGDEPALVKLVDFGVAKLVDEHAPDAFRRSATAGAIVGTPMYIAPEQAQDSDEAGWSSDVYSLGCIAFELLTGRPPFAAETMFEMFAKHVTEPPPVPSSIVPEIPEEIDRLVLGMLAKSPLDRPTMGHVRQVLERVRDLRELAAPRRIITVRQTPIAGIPAQEPPQDFESDVSEIKVRFAGPGEGSAPHRLASEPSAPHRPSAPALAPTATHAPRRRLPSWLPIAALAAVLAAIALVAALVR